MAEGAVIVKLAAVARAAPVAALILIVSDLLEAVELVRVVAVTNTATALTRGRNSRMVAAHAVRM